MKPGLADAGVSSTLPNFRVPDPRFVRSYEKWRNQRLLTPASAVLPPRHGADCGSLESAEELIRAQWPMTFVPCLGLPAATVPTGVIEGLPGSVQIVGGRFRESWILDAAQAIEDRAGVLTPIDPFRAP